MVRVWPAPEFQQESRHAGQKLSDADRRLLAAGMRRQGGGSLAPADVTAAPTQWGDQTIRVSGRLGFGSHERCVCRKGRSSDGLSDCLTLVNTYPIKARLARLHRHWVTVTGTVIPDTWRAADGNAIIDFGSCGRVGLRVDAVE